MYPRNNASPEPIAIGPVVQISDGAVQTSGCTVRIKPIGVAEGDGAGTTAYSTDGIVLYTPTQAETNYTSFILIAKKTGCLPVSVTVVTTSSATPGTVLLAPVTHTSAVVPTVSVLTGHTAQTGDTYALANGASGFVATKADTAAILVDTGTTLQAELDGIQADTEDIQARLPAALTADGNIKADTLRVGGTLQTAGDISALVTTVDTVVDAILVDTAEIGAAGAGLTALAQSSSWTGTLATNLATTNSTVASNLNATITSRMASYVQPTGFLAATFPTIVASTTNITAASGVTLSSAGNTAVATAVEAAILDEGDATALLAAIAAKVEEFLVNEGDATATIAAIAAACNSAIVAGTVGTNVTAIKAKTDNLPASPAAVGSAMALAADAITTAAIANNAITGAKFAANALNGLGDWNTIAPATPTNISDAQTAIIAQVDANETKIDTGNAILTKLNSGLEDDGSGGYQGTALFLENAPSGSGLTAQQTRDAMKLAPSAGAAASGSIDDQLAGIQTAVDELDTGTGSGARTVTITVNDGTTVLQNAKVRLTEGVNTYTGLTNVSGVVVFSVDDATYAVAITKSGYQFTPTTLIVNGTETATYSMTATVVTPATDPEQSTLAITCYDENLELEAGAVLRLTMTRVPTDDVGRSFDSKSRVLTADSSGYIEATVARLAEYTIERGDSYQYRVRVEIPDSDTCTVESVLGKEVL